MEWKPVKTVLLPGSAELAAVANGHDSNVVELVFLNSVVSVDWGLKRSWERPCSVERHGCAAVSIGGQIILVGGRNSTSGELENTAVEVSIGNGNADTTCSEKLSDTRWLPGYTTIGGKFFVVGGRNSAGTTLSSVECLEDGSWHTLPASLPTGPRMAPAVENYQGSLLLLGGYDGFDWTTSCSAYSLDNKEWWDLPSLPNPLRFPKATVYSPDVIVVAGDDGEGDIRVVRLSMNFKQLGWKSIPLVPPEGVVVEALCQRGDELCLVTKDKDGRHVFTHKVITSPPRSETSSTLSSLSAASAVSKTRRVKEIFLPGNCPSRYTGQMSKISSSWVPHGEGCEIWADEKHVFHPISDRLNSYYRGSYEGGFRSGSGEMYLRADDKHYTGEFRDGAWHGMGCLEIPSKRFRYFGEFLNGHMSGHGRCIFRAPCTLEDSSDSMEMRDLVFVGEMCMDLAVGLGTISDAATGEVIETRTFDNENLAGA